MTFEWTQVHRLIYTNGSKPPDGLEFWMGDSRGRWEGDTLVVDVTDHNDRTWFDMAGNFHSEALKVVERYTLLDATRCDTKRRSRIPRYSPGRGRSACRCTGTRTWTGCSNTSARRRRKRPTALSSAIRAPGIHNHDASIHRGSSPQGSGAHRLFLAAVLVVSILASTWLRRRLSPPRPRGRCAECRTGSRT